MELIDKQKFYGAVLARYQEYIEQSNIHDAAILGSVLTDIESGSIDDHSVQEEIAKLKAERDNIKVGRDNERVLKNEVIKQYEVMEARAIQAEQEKDAAMSAFKTERGKTRMVQAERNALLEGLKVVFRIASDKSTTPRSDKLEAFEGYVRSIIAKLEPGGESQ